MSTSDATGDAFLPIFQSIFRKHLGEGARLALPVVSLQSILEEEWSNELGGRYVIQSLLDQLPHTGLDLHITPDILESCYRRIKQRDTGEQVLEIDGGDSAAIAPEVDQALIKLSHSLRRDINKVNNTLTRVDVDYATFKSDSTDRISSVESQMKQSKTTSTKLQAAVRRLHEDLDELQGIRSGHASADDLVKLQKECRGFFDALQERFNDVEGHIEQLQLEMNSRDGVHARGIELCPSISDETDVEPSLAEGIEPSVVADVHGADVIRLTSNLNGPADKVGLHVQLQPTVYRPRELISSHQVPVAVVDSPKCDVDASVHRSSQSDDHATLASILHSASSYISIILEPLYQVFLFTNVPERASAEEQPSLLRRALLLVPETSGRVVSAFLSGLQIIAEGCLALIQLPLGVLFVGFYLLSLIFSSGSFRTSLHTRTSQIFVGLITVVVVVFYYYHVSSTLRGMQIA